jgi:bleomycin hydrolase
MAKDQLDNLYYFVKNSWGTKGKNEGYEYVSESFVLYKTLSIYVHKDVIPKQIMKKIKE